jgi:L-fuculose-phosphate aldolase
MNEQGLNQGSAGNLSVRVREGFLITPSALAYDRCTEADLVAVALDGESKGERRPSSEWRFHRDIYIHRPEAGAVLHCHSPWATTLACLEKDIPPFHYMVGVAGGPDIRCAPYTLFGTQELSDLALEALEGRFACLLAHHGLLCLAEKLDAVFSLAMEVEALARIYVQALQVREPPLLSSHEMEQVLLRFTDYRQGGK